MSLEDILNAKLEDWSKTDKGRKAIGKAIKGSVGVAGRPATDTMMMKYAQHMRDILREEIAAIISTTTGDDFLNYIDIDSSIKVITANGKEQLSVGISFNKDFVMRNSLYSDKYDPVYMPTLVNNEWNVKTENRVSGYDRWGTFTVGVKKWIHEGDKGFIQRAVDRFNAEMSPKGVIAEYRADYDGGSY